MSGKKRTEDGRGWVGRNLFFLCLSKVLAQYQLARHLRNDHELIIWPHKKGLHWNLLLELPAKQNKNCISVSSDPQLYRNTHFDKGQKSMTQQKNVV